MEKARIINAIHFILILNSITNHNVNINSGMAKTNSLSSPKEQNSNFKYTAIPINKNGVLTVFLYNKRNPTTLIVAKTILAVLYSNVTLISDHQASGDHLPWMKNMITAKMKESVAPKTLNIIL